MNNDIKFLNIHMILPHQIWRPFLDCMHQLFLDNHMCGFWYICILIWSLNSTVQLAELIVYIIPLE